MENQMLKFLQIRRERVARKLDFNAGASKDNPIVDFALAHFDYQQEHLKLTGEMPPEDQHSVNHNNYYVRMKYNRGKQPDLKDKAADKKGKRVAQGQKYYSNARAKGQGDMMGQQDNDALALDIADMLGGD